jgi:WD40 repeat protein
MWLTFDPRGDQIATVSLDGTVRVWDARSGALRFVPPAEPGGVEAVAFSADGSRIVVVYASGRILVHPIALPDAIEIARGRVTRSLTDDECRQYLHLEACPS